MRGICQAPAPLLPEDGAGLPQLQPRSSAWLHEVEPADTLPGTGVDLTSVCFLHYDSSPFLICASHTVQRLPSSAWKAFLAILDLEIHRPSPLPSSLLPSLSTFSSYITSKVSETSPPLSFITWGCSCWSPRLGSSRGSVLWCPPGLLRRLASSTCVASAS